jgi:hypothetical protein
MYDDNESKLFQPSLTSISNLNSGTFSIVINPFGEAYPELGNAEGIGLKTILSYIRDSGIFVNSGGQPFFYSWDVNTGSHQLLVSFIPALSNIESSYIEGIPKLSINTNLGIPHEALLLKRYFNVETEWDHPEKDIVGPKEVIIQFDQLLGDDTKPKTKANVYNVINFFSIVTFHGYFSSFPSLKRYTMCFTVNLINNFYSNSIGFYGTRIQRK